MASLVGKRKRRGYWPRYEKGCIKDFRELWHEIDVIVAEVGVPFKRSRRGRPPKFGDLAVYAKMAVMLAVFDYDLRELEGELTSVLDGSTLDHTNISRWFGKLDEEWVVSMVQALHQRIVVHFRRGAYITDSTGITTDRYIEVISGGKPKRDLLTIKLHVLIAYFSTAGVLSIAAMAATYGDQHDAPPLARFLADPNVPLRAGYRLHGDRAYPSNENLRLAYERRLIPNLRFREGHKHGLILARAREDYDDELRKRIRGLVEGLFGGIATTQGTRTRFRKDHHRKLHALLLGLAHEIKTWRRVRAAGLILITIYAPTPEKP
jgi:hypothetical protein